MYRNVTEYLARQTGEIFKMPAFTRSYNTILDCMKVISQENPVQTLNRWGDSPEKKKRKKDLLELMCHASAILTAYAKLTDNNILFAEVKFTPWQLGRVHQVKLPMVAGILYERAQQHLDKLGDYGFTRELLNEFRKAIDEYSESIPFPRAAKVTSTLATKKMEESFKKADEALEMLDILIASKKYSEAGLYSGYCFARKLINEGRVKMALKVQAVNKADNTPVARALFRFVLTEPQRETSKKGHTIIKKTMKQGGFYILHIPPGKYEITVSKSGYATSRIEEYIDDKELKRMRVEMEKEL